MLLREKSDIRWDVLHKVITFVMETTLAPTIVFKFSSFSVLCKGCFMSDFKSWT